MTPRPSLRWLCWVLIGCSSSLAALHAQSLPPRDRPPEQTGTGKIKGRVVDAQSASGVPRARVRISGPQLINAAPGLTDDMGRFEFANLAAGRFFLLSTASLSALGYEHNRSQPVIRLWDDTRHITG